MTFTVDMGPPRLDWRDIPLREAADTLAVDLGPMLDEAGLQRPVAVGMGNPHAVFFVPDVAAVDLAAWGPRFERHPMFPDRANISFAEVEATDRISPARLGTGCRADARLRFGRLRHAGRGLPARARRASRPSRAAGRGLGHGVARGRPRADDGTRRAGASWPRRSHDGRPSAVVTRRAPASRS